MFNNSIIRLATLVAILCSIRWAAAQSGAASGLYEILSGNYTECCGIGGGFGFSLPNQEQSFVKLKIDPPGGPATMTFLGSDARTIFSVVPCPPGTPINFDLQFGFVSSNSIVFHVDPGPPPYGVFWNYTVSNSTDRLRIEGTLGTAQPTCADVPTRFTHSDVVAVLVPRPKIRITEYSKDGALLFIQGKAGWKHVVEASPDLAAWTPIYTNVMPFTLCPVCPYILYSDTDSTNAVRRFYRCAASP